jgi:phosphohistidine phosphatase SixA
MKKAPRYLLCLVVTVALAASLTGLPLAPAADGESALWDALRNGGHVALMRHSNAPGTGDPSNFSLRDCTTQRNLSEEGRRQSTKIGQRLLANGILGARVYSSQWCRCLDTARLIGMGHVTELPILNSFFQQSERESAQNQALVKWLAAQNLDQPPILVTHQVNITAISGVYPVSGEILIMRRAKTRALSLVGTLKTD